ncbi:unnamed protein product [Musa textilis]
MAEGATAHIPIDVMELILMHIYPKSAVRLSITCKEWRATAPRYDPTMGRTPWLVKFNQDCKCSCILQSVVDEDTSCKTFSSKSLPLFHLGWLVTSTLQLYNLSVQSLLTGIMVPPSSQVLYSIFSHVIIPIQL